ncbi:MAG: hypothetical protein ACXAC0_09940 [Candidatus Thorarchaeota archaeon]|jgi:hypothetical protein
MSTEFEDNEEEQFRPEEKEIDWLEYAQQEQQALRPLDGKDYIALFVASIQTIFLPLVILVIVLLAVNFWLQIVAG